MQLKKPYTCLTMIDYDVMINADNNCALLMYMLLLSLVLLYVFFFAIIIRLFIIYSM